MARRRKEDRRAALHHEEAEALGSLLLPYAATGVSLRAVWCLSSAIPRGQTRTPAVTLPQGCDGLIARRRAVWWTFRAPSLCCHVRRELLRNAWLVFTPRIPATACQQRNYVETFSRFSALRRKCATFRRKTNTYAKSTKGLQRLLRVYWVVHNFLRVHFTTREVPAVALGLLERRLSVQEIFQIQMA